MILWYACTSPLVTTMQVTKYTNGNGILIDIQALQGSKMNINPKISRLNTSAHRDMPISFEGTHAHTWSTQLFCILRLGLGLSGVPASGGESVEVGTLP